MDRQEAEGSERTEQEGHDDAGREDSREQESQNVLEAAESEISNLGRGRSVKIPLVGEFPVRILIALAIFLAVFMAVWMLLWALLGGIGLGLGWIIAGAAGAWAFHAYAREGPRASARARPEQPGEGR